MKTPILTPENRDKIYLNDESTIDLYDSLRRRARNVNFQSLSGGRFTLSTQLINPKFYVSRPHRHSTTVSLETNPLV